MPLRYALEIDDNAFLHRQIRIREITCMILEGYWTEYKSGSSLMFFCRHKPWLLFKARVTSAVSCLFEKLDWQTLYDAGYHGHIQAMVELQKRSPFVTGNSIVTVLRWELE